MPLFSYRICLLCLLIMATYISGSMPSYASAILPASGMNNVSQLSVYIQKNGRDVLPILTARKSKSLSKKSVASTLRGKKSATRSKRSHSVRKNTRKSQRTRSQGTITQDLSYLGVLEGPRRYDPSSNQQRGAVPNPRARDVRVDHFQELDKNQDGVLDPIERATSRLDIDRDLSNRHWK